MLSIIQFCVQNIVGGQEAANILFKGHLYPQITEEQEENIVTECLCDATGDTTFSVFNYLSNLE